MCQFTIPFTGSGEELITRAKQEIENSGGTFAGDASYGIFKVKTPVGTIEGSYSMAVTDISIAITKKPFLVSCRKIEKELRGVMV